MKKLPNPGSKKAVKLGCTCPVIDNGRGYGHHGQKDVFVYTVDCLVHHPERVKFNQLRH